MDTVTAADASAPTFQRFTDFDAKLSIEYDEGASQKLGIDYWRVIQGFKFFFGDLSEEKWVFIPAGYLTDGASVPRLLWSLLPPWGAYGQAAVLHDYLCENLTIQVHGVATAIPRAKADAAFKEAMVALDVPRWKRNVMYIAVRVYAKFHKSQDSKAAEQKAAYETAWQAAHPVAA